MITVFGLGFVGLTTALGFAEMGYKVYGVEVNQERLQTIQSGKLPFLEPGLDEALLRHLGRGFIAGSNLNEAIAESEYIFYCVGTPYGEGGQADLTYLFQAIDQTLSCIKDDKYRVLVTKSTIPPSTTSEKIIPFLRAKGWELGERIGVANNPEFLREGHCWDDFIQADRIVLGVSDERSAQMLRHLYSQNNSAPVYCVSLNTGEFIKYLSNTLLATMISYANEMSIVSDTVGDIDTAEAFRILLMDRRWKNGSMSSYVYPGAGYGGYCLPKDTNALFSLVQNQGYEAKILKNVIAVNEQMPKVICSRILKTAKVDQAIGILGLSFKPNSDDVRDTAAAKIINCLLEEGCSRLYAYDPVAIEEFKKHYPHLNSITYVDDYEQMLEKVDVLVIVTAWDVFKTIRSKTDKPIIDSRFML
jgi:UDPglucose 6-dehydrogenase